MILYHGTDLNSAANICKQGIDLGKSQKKLDFGAGFYTTPDIEKAKKRALLKSEGNAARARIVAIEVDDVRFASLIKKEFNNANQEWCEFILINRCGKALLSVMAGRDHNLDNRYDVVCGEIADSSISSIVYEIKKGKRKAEEVNYSELLPDSLRSYGYQISFHTKKSLSCIIKCSCDRISERKVR
ncbi:MAG: DUF3990 domain-containing protein [Lachnospiraceae bacterium]|nr:DUF3990 domain-containing protein [Lachnospiraceae bacterium]